LSRSGIYLFTSVKKCKHFKGNTVLEITRRSFGQLLFRIRNTTLYYLSRYYKRREDSMLPDDNSMLECQKLKRDLISEAWITELCDIVGKENILKKFSECLPYGRDRSPYSTLKYRFGKLPQLYPLLLFLPNLMKRFRRF